jgi:transcription initiation factor TFIIIB Brf1 subunit/transcription initiation factor TFIIB
MSSEILKNYIDDLFKVDEESKEKFDIYFCNICNEYSNITFDGQIVCKLCSKEHGNIVDNTAEWRNYNSDYSRGVDHTRCSSIINPMLIDSSYGSTIGFTKDPKFLKLKQTILWNSSKYPERMLKSAFNKLSFNGNMGGLKKNIIERSHKLFYDLTQKRTELNINSSRGSINEGLIASCTMLACKEFGFPRSPKEIAKMYGISKSDVTSGWNLFKKMMPEYAGMITESDEEENCYSILISRYCGYLKMTKDQIEKVQHCINVAEREKILTKNTPESLICGCIYFVIVSLKLNITKTYLSEKCNISVATINKTYQKLIEHTDELI